MYLIKLPFVETGDSCHSNLVFYPYLYTIPLFEFNFLKEIHKWNTKKDNVCVCV